MNAMAGRLTIALLLAAAASPGAPVFAASPAVEAYRAQLLRAKEEYRAERQRCDRLPRTEREPCVAQARAAQERSRAEARATFHDSPRARMEARIAVAEADYDLALVQCKAAAERDACEAAARVERARATERARLDYAYGEDVRDHPAVDADTSASTNVTRALGTHECAALLDIDERYRCIRNAEEAGRM
jgi:hypothetical protein